MMKNELQEGGSETHDFGMVFCCPGVEMQKQAFRFIRVAKYEVPVFHEKES